MTGIEVAAIAAVAALGFKAAKGVCTPVTLAEMERTTRSLDNRIPDDLRARATGLGVLVGRARCLGLRDTSIWRGLALNEAIRNENAAKGVNQEFATGNPAAPGDHTLARGTDFAPGTRENPVRVNRTRGTAEERAEALRLLTDVRDRLMADPDVGPFVVRALIEDDHVHVRFNEAMLEDLGNRFTTKARTFIANKVGV